MINIFIYVVASLGTIGMTNWSALDYLKQHGYSAEEADVIRALQDSFEHKDQNLFLQTTQYLESVDRMDKYAQLLIDEYHNPEYKAFADPLGVTIAAIICNIPRFAESKYGCEFYHTAISHLIKQDARSGIAVVCIELLSDRAGLRLDVYVIKTLVNIPRQSRGLYFCEPLKAAMRSR